MGAPTSNSAAEPALARRALTAQKTLADRPKKSYTLFALFCALVICDHLASVFKHIIRLDPTPPYLKVKPNQMFSFPLENLSPRPQLPPSRPNHPFLEGCITNGKKQKALKRGSAQRGKTKSALESEIRIVMLLAEKRCWQSSYALDTGVRFPS